MDRDNQGAISSLDFRHVLRQFSVNLEEDEFFHLLSYYDKNLNGMIAYNDFIKAYLQHPWVIANIETRSIYEKVFSGDKNICFLFFFRPALILQTAVVFLDRDH